MSETPNEKCPSMTEKHEHPITDEHLAACLKSGGRSCSGGRNAYSLARELEKKAAKAELALGSARYLLMDWEDGRGADDLAEKVGLPVEVVTNALRRIFESNSQENPHA